MSFQVERRNADTAENGDWQALATVVNDYSWTGNAEPGSWIYRVATVEIQANGNSQRCKPGWVHVSIDVLTADELVRAALLQSCLEAEVYDLRATVAVASNWPDKTLTLQWNAGLYFNDVSDQLPRSDVIHYRVERTGAPDRDNSHWQTVAEVANERTWTGPANPGRWIYRVAVVKVESGGVAVDCEPRWATTEVRILTDAERARLEQQRSILMKESVRCATDDLTNNLRSSARAVVGEYVEERLGEIFAEMDDNGDETSTFHALVYWTILLCSDDRPSFFGFSPGLSWAMLLLFDDYSNGLL